MECKPNCGACCVAISISSPIPGMPQGKPAGVACVNLDLERLTCRIWGRDDYPEVCRRFLPCAEICASREVAMATLTALEIATAPDGPGRRGRDGA